jgi:hypothetical protein
MFASHANRVSKQSSVLKTARIGARDGTRERERRRKWHEGRLLQPLAIRKEEQLILHKRPTQTSAEVVALIVRVLSAGKFAIKALSRNRLKRIAVHGVGARFRNNVHGTGGSQLGRQIQSRLAQLKFIDRARGDVLRRRSTVSSLISIPSSAMRAVRPIAAAKRNRRKTILSRIEVATVLNLHARLKLREIEKVAATERQGFDLLTGQNTLHRWLFSC